MVQSSPQLPPPATPARKWWRRSRGVKFFVCCAIVLLVWLTLEEQRQWRLRKWALGTELDEIMLAELGHGAGEISAARFPGLDLQAGHERETFFESSVDGASMSPRYAGWTLRMRFDDDPISRPRLSLRGWDLIPPAGMPPRGPSRGWWLFEAGRECINELSILALGGGMVLFLFAWRSRRSIGQLVLAVAIISIVVKAFEPDLRWSNVRWSAPILDAWVTLNARVLVAIAALLILLIPSRKPRQQERGYCLHCNYNLTGNQSGICPECGRTTAAWRRRKREDRLQQFADSLERMKPWEDSSK